MKCAFSEEKLKLKQYVLILEMSLKTIQEGKVNDYDLFVTGIKNVRSDLAEYCKIETKNANGVSEKLDLFEAKLVSKLEKMDVTLQQTETAVLNTHAGVAKDYDLFVTRTENVRNNLNGYWQEQTKQVSSVSGFLGLLEIRLLSKLE